MFVVDASVILAWCLDDESSDTSDVAMKRLLSEGAIAPAHWPVELASALRSAERRGRIDQQSFDRLRIKLSGLPVEVVPVELSTALGVVETARRYDLSVYDATYLDLADIRGLGLATIDGRLADACRTAGVPLIAA